MPRHAEWDRWMRRVGALAVAGVAAYASYIHQYDFALQGGADTASAALWPLSVDGLLLLATASLLKRPDRTNRRLRWTVWAAFFMGIAVSLAANIAAAPALAWKPMLVAGWPPVALLLAVELLAHGPSARVETVPGSRPGVDEAVARDLLLDQACQVDARHRELHQRPVSAESLRKELHIGTERSRQLVRQVRASRNGDIMQ
ncbi:hypothetical protein GCM10022403_084380 [Streptomyces coacervatus]|uniref:DUF2637 domain-containing protein n=1 Tax=Streptomyces coacervatus TaxID=647381 RepID=A0ABP7JB75_9ACTN|nr:DUF2637 domain-containing protein [Streptomyces coacervatus]MDF2271858.1 DUF2637 domain-containing protein [Streptomyces coacervatus]